MVKRIVPLILSALILVGLFSGCGSSGAGVIRMDIGGPVLNLDPLYASGQDAGMIIANLYEGLVVKGADGDLRPGAADSWKISPDGLTYTFTLRPDAKWEDGEPLLAEHFVFAFRRMFSRGSPSPYAWDYSVIENGSEALAGSKTIYELGVSAIGNTTLEFRLSRPSTLFLELLSAAPAMPCREDIFTQSMGRYGLEIKYVHTNGPFTLTRWDNSSFIQLTPNPNYREDFNALPERVVFYVGRESPADQFQNGRSEIIFLAPGAAAGVELSKAKVIPVEKTVWCIAFNGSGDIFKSPLLRQALGMTVNREEFAYLLPDDFSAASSFVLPGMGAGSHSDLAADNPPLSFDPAEGRRLYGLALGFLEIEELPQITLHIPQGEGRGVAQSIAAEWKKQLGVSVIIVEAGPDEHDALMRSGDFEMMLIPFSPADENPAVLLGAFRSASMQNYFGYKNIVFDELLLTAAQEADEAGAAARLRLAEEILLRDAAVIPLWRERSFWALSQGLTGVEISPFSGRILFANAEKR